MTQNMDAGTDQGYIVAAAMPSPPFTLPVAVDLTYAELQLSNLEQRAGLLAKQIAEKQPDIVALQEVTLWRTGSSPETATTPLYDQLAFLLSALLAQKVPYDVVAVNTVDDVALPGQQIPALRFTDRDVLLVRSDLRPPTLHFSDVHARTFDAVLPFAGLRIASGWISASVHLGNRHFLLVATHLESSIPGVPLATDVQVAQAQELLHEVRNAAVPVVICGDFNSDANDHQGPVDATPTASLIRAAGYADVWRLIHGSDPGYTWPVYLEDQDPIAFPSYPPPFERIDLFFSQGMQVLGADQVFAPALAGATPPAGSDHTGVIATFRP
jgi:endonuclease/exonuclease/phosphatase family metal-dependent hydrolase